MELEFGLSSKIRLKPSTEIFFGSIDTAKNSKLKLILEPVRSFFFKNAGSRKTYPR